VLQDMLDSIAWINRLSSTFVSAIGELYRNIRRTEPEMFGDPSSGGVLGKDDALRKIRMFVEEVDQIAPAG